MNGEMYSRLAVDTNAVIEYRAGVAEVCSLIESADIIIRLVAN